MDGEIKPLTMEAWMILDDPTTQPQALAQDLPPLLLLFFFSQTPSFPLKFLFWFCVHNGRKRKRKMVFITCFLTSSLSCSCLALVFEWKESEEKWFL